MVMVVPGAAVVTAIDAIGAHGILAVVVGEVVPATSVSGSRYAEGPLEGTA
jgi:hypothetical protein